MGGLPELSNCYCHPGRAGGLPVWANLAGKRLSGSKPEASCASLAKDTRMMPHLTHCQSRFCIAAGDSTLFEILESIRCMKKAVLYARVSSDLQKKEHTIESQIVELRKQVAAAGDILIKEYTDDGYSGARLDRPALDQLRNDLKTPLFDTIYFLNTDRIARDVTYQTIIIAEILKHQKQIIINGVDYVHNPENKFTLTVLGAVAELERTKIIERVTRAKQLRLAQGCLLGCGANIYGYDYKRRTPASPPALTVNEEEAAVVREIFATYAKGQVGMNQITRGLEDRGVPTKGGHKLWRTSLLKQMLRSETYCGVKYFNTQRRVREYANPLHGTRSSSKCMKRPRNEWVGVKVPAIVSQALFDEVQERFAWNRQHYRNPQRVQLLSSLIRCGSCGGSFFGYRRYFTKDLKHDPGHVYHKAAYTCNWRHRAQMHSKKSSVERCQNKEVKAELLDARVCTMIEEIMLDPEKLKGCMDFFKGTTRAAHLKLKEDLRAIDRRMQDVDEAKHRIMSSCSITSKVSDAPFTRPELSSRA